MNNSVFSAKAAQFTKDLKKVFDYKNSTGNQLDIDYVIRCFEDEFEDNDLYKGFKKLNGNPWQKIKAYYEYALMNYSPRFGGKPGELDDFFGHVLDSLEPFFYHNGILKPNWKKFADNEDYYDDDDDEDFSVCTESTNYFPY